MSTPIARGQVLALSILALALALSLPAEMPAPPPPKRRTFLQLRLQRPEEVHVRCCRVRLSVWSSFLVCVPTAFSCHSLPVRVVELVYESIPRHPIINKCKIGMDERGRANTSMDASASNMVSNACAMKNSWQLLTFRVRPSGDQARIVFRERQRRSAKTTASASSSELTCSDGPPSKRWVA